MKVQMKLMSDMIFGNGSSIPGGEDIAVQCDRQGFPFYKGGTLKGVFREELERVLLWNGKDQTETEQTINRLLGFSGDDTVADSKLCFSDFVLPDGVKKAMLKEIGNRPDTVTEALTNLRTFTAIDGEGTVKDGSLRMARCVNAGLIFEGEILCREEDAALVSETLSMMKWLGTMRSRGFGKVKISVIGKGDRA